MRCTPLRRLAAALFATLFILPIGVRAVGQLPDASGAVGPHASLFQELDLLLGGVYAPNEPGAVVLVRKEGEILLRKGYGLANMEWNQPTDPTVVFHLGSISKQFTAMAILMLVQEGKLTLDTPLSRFFPDAPPELRSITIEHLLTHTSGLANYTALPDYQIWNRSEIEPEQIVRRIFAEPPQFKPGERWAYCDSGYFLLGVILEKVCGKKYPEIIQERIFDRLGMHHSTYDRAEKIVTHRAAGYMKTGTGFTNAPYLDMSVPYAAGALMSTVDDLALWNTALDRGELVRRDLLQRAFIPYKLNDGSSAYYGYAWAINEYEGHTLIEHGGTISGFEDHVIRIPDAGILVILLTNGMGRRPGPDFLATKIAAALLGKPWNPIAVKISEDTAREYVGNYRADEHTTRRITLEGGRLYSQRDSGARQEIFPLGHDEFFFNDSFTRIHFERDAGGTVARMVVKTKYGAASVATRMTPEPAPHPP